MKWTLLDGSPRGRKSNTSLLLHAVARGLEAAGSTTEMAHLAVARDRAGAPELFARSERFLLGFPLYTDAMPSQVMDFVEKLEPLQRRPENPPVVFLVQSGFPEPGHSRAVEGYLEQLAARLGSRYLGTIVKGGVEGIQAAPSWMRRRLLVRFEQIGRTLGAKDCLEPRALRALAGPEWLDGWRSPVLRAVLGVGINPHWSRVLRRNGAWQQRFDRPYESG